MSAEPVITLVAIIKNSSYVAGFIITSEFLGFNAEAGSILILLMMVDTLTGIIRSASLNGMPSVTSSIGIRGLLAKILTLTAIISLAFAFKGIGYNAQAVTQGITSVFILAETYSIIGNVHSTLTKKPKAEYDAIVFLVSIARNLLEKYSGKTSDIIKK